MENARPGAAPLCAPMATLGMSALCAQTRVICASLSTEVVRSQDARGAIIGL